VPTIVREVLGRDLNWIADDAVSFNEDDGRLLDEICAERDVPPELVVKLLDIERAAHGLKRRHAVHTRIEDLFRQEWRSLDALLALRTAGRDGDGAMATDEVEDTPTLGSTDGDAG
jgi:DNA sulfur modification protein DndC